MYHYHVIKIYKTREVGQPLIHFTFANAVKCGERWNSMINDGLQNRNYKIIVNPNK